MQITGHMVDEQGNKVAGPTIAGSFSGVLTVHFEDGSQRRLWEKDCPAKGQRRCLPAAQPQSSTSQSLNLPHVAGTRASKKLCHLSRCQDLSDCIRADTPLHLEKSGLCNMQVPVLRLGRQPE